MTELELGRRAVQLLNDPNERYGMPHAFNKMVARARSLHTLQRRFVERTRNRRAMFTIKPANDTEQFEFAMAAYRERR